MLFILTGNIQIGKTRWLTRLLDEVQTQGVLPFGVIAPGIWKRGVPGAEHVDENGFEKLGINNVLLPQEKTILFAQRRDIALKQGVIDETSQSERANLLWYMPPSAIDEVNAHFEKACKRGTYAYACECAQEREKIKASEKPETCETRKACEKSNESETRKTREYPKTSGTSNPIAQVPLCKQAFLVVDELGRLELLKGEGLTYAMQLLQQGQTNGCAHALVVVREQLRTLAEEQLGDTWGGCMNIYPNQQAEECVLSALKLSAK